MDGQTTITQQEQSTQLINNSDGLKEGEIGLNADGEIEFSDSYLDSEVKALLNLDDNNINKPPEEDVKKQDEVQQREERQGTQGGEEDGQQKEKTIEQKQPETQQKQVESPVSFYTPEEIADTQLSQIDEARLPEAVRPFFEPVKAVLTRVSRYEQALMNYEQQLKALEATLNNKQLAAAAQPQQQQQQQTQQQPQLSPKDTYMKLLKDSKDYASKYLLGIEPGDFDDYSPNHSAALNHAMGILREQQTQKQPEASQVQPTQQQLSMHTQLQLQLMNEEINAMPDAAAFNQFAESMINVMPAQMRALIANSVAVGDLRILKDSFNLLKAEYKKYKQKTQGTNLQQTQQTTTQSQVKKRSVEAPPPLEGGVGTTPASKTPEYGDLAKYEDDPEKQADVLMQIVFGKGN